MNSQTTRLMKEARSLFWPWFLITVAGGIWWLLFRLGISPNDGPLAYAGEFGFLLGIPLLSTLSLGNEFQHRTLSLMLSQPGDRMTIWRDKWNVTMIAVLSVGAVYYELFRQELWLGEYLGMAVTVWSAAIVGSAVFWTLVARSTIGGLILNIGAMITGFGIVGGLGQWAFGDRPTAIQSLRLSSISSIAVLCYAVVMLWLGRRKFARFQTTGGIGGGDLLVAGPNVLPEAFAGLFRSSPTRMVLNLIRKELRLLRPIWFLALLAILFLICLTPLRSSSWVTPVTTAANNPVGPGLAFIAIMLYLLLALPLAGSLSLGEERTTGSHAWHMTLPVSIRLQWLVKLVMAILVSFLSSAMVVTAARLLLGARFGAILDSAFLDHEALCLLGVSLLSFPAFWCACAVNGTVRATLCVFPAASLVMAAGPFGASLSIALRSTSAFRSAVSMVHTIPTDNFWNFVWALEFGPLFALLVALPAALFAVFQSYRLFRREAQDSILSVIRGMLPLVILAFVCGFLARVPVDLAYSSSGQMFDSSREAHRAVAKMQLDVSKLDAAHPLQFTPEYLAKASPLSEIAWRWLANSIIEVAPQSADRSWLAIHSLHSDYVTTIHFESGWDCGVYGKFYYNCKSLSHDWGSDKPPPDRLPTRSRVTR